MKNLNPLRKKGKYSRLRQKSLKVSWNCKQTSWILFPRVMKKWVRKSKVNWSLQWLRSISCKEKKEKWEMSYTLTRENWRRPKNGWEPQKWSWIQGLRRMIIWFLYLKTLKQRMDFMSKRKSKCQCLLRKVENELNQLTLRETEFFWKSKIISDKLQSLRILWKVMGRRDNRDLTKHWKPLDLNTKPF